MRSIADAGLLIDFLDRGDAHHKKAARLFELESPLL
jgi:predicted nucleic acid-binding protein